MHWQGVSMKDSIETSEDDFNQQSEGVMRFAASTPSKDIFMTPVCNMNGISLNDLGNIF